jgi:hypothetical protein
MKRAVGLNQEIEPQVHVNLHTLEAYAEKYFRSKKTTAWHYEATEIKGPLLHRFEGQAELTAKAIQMFRAIMNYAKMTPQERKKIQQSDLDSIFDYAYEKNVSSKKETTVWKFSVLFRKH